MLCLYTVLYWNTRKKRKENIIMMGVLGQIIFVPLTPITKEWFSTSFYYGRKSERGVLSSSFCPQTRDDGEKLNALFFAGWMVTDWGAYDTPCLVPVLARKVVHLWYICGKKWLKKSALDTDWRDSLSRTGINLSHVISSQSKRKRKPRENFQKRMRWARRKKKSLKPSWWRKQK